MDLVQHEKEEKSPRLFQSSSRDGHGSVTSLGWLHDGYTDKSTLQGIPSEMGAGFEWIC